MREALPIGGTRDYKGPMNQPALPTIDDVLSFWFSNPTRWWVKDPVFDSEIRDRFLPLHEAIVRGECEDWLRTPRGTVAYIVVLDQFSRNMFRGTARMFDSDAQARAAAARGLDRGDDRSLSPEERVFLCMPFMHSEDIADQERSVALFATAPSDNLRFAVLHRDIVQRFGRFPHRNAVLGRDSMPEEVEFLKQPGSSF